MEQKQLPSHTKMHQRLAPCFFWFFFARARFKNQTTRRTDDKLGFIVQHKLNQVFEYSNNDGDNFKQFSPCLAYPGENKVIPPSMGSKNALVSV